MSCIRCIIRTVVIHVTSLGIPGHATYINKLEGSQNHVFAQPLLTSYSNSELSQNKIWTKKKFSDNVSVTSFLEKKKTVELYSYVEKFKMTFK